MTPEEHFFCALMALEMTPGEKQEFVAEFRRSLIEHDTRVLEDFLYGAWGAADIAAHERDFVQEIVLAVSECLKEGKSELYALAVVKERFAAPAPPPPPVPPFADTSTCSRCGEEYPTDDDEWCEACLRVGGST